MARSETTRRTVYFVSLSNVVWGGEQSLLAVAEGLAADGVSVELLCTSEELAAAWVQRTGSKVVVMPSKSTRLARVIVAARHVARLKTPGLVLAWDVDLVPVLVALRPWLTARGFWTALDLHMVITGRRGQRVFRLVAGRIDFVVAVSSYIAAQVPPSHSGVRVVWRPMNVDSAPRVYERGVRRRVGVVGRIDAIKRVDVAIEAMQSLPDTYVLEVRGAAMDPSSTLPAELRALAERVAPGRVRFAGMVDQGQAMDDIDFLVLCNPIEPSGRVVSEAQAAHVVTVVPDSGGAQEFVEHGVTGLIYTSLSPTDLAAALRAAEGAETMAGLVMAGWQHARAEYDPSAQAKKYADAVGLELPGSQ